MLQATTDDETAMSRPLSSTKILRKVSHEFSGALGRRLKSYRDLDLVLEPLKTHCHLAEQVIGRKQKARQQKHGDAMKRLKLMDGDLCRTPGHKAAEVESKKQV